MRLIDKHYFDSHSRLKYSKLTTNPKKKLSLPMLKISATKTPPHHLIVKLSCLDLSHFYSGFDRRKTVEGIVQEIINLKNTITFLEITELLCTFGVLLIVKREFHIKCYFQNMSLAVFHISRGYIGCKKYQIIISLEKF